MRCSARAMAAFVLLGGLLHASEALAQPTPQYPIGQITHVNPTYRWTAYAGASWYNVMVDRYDTGTGQWSGMLQLGRVAASGLCPSPPTCGWYPGVALSAGQYRWNVRADNSAWSSKVTFQLSAPATPATVAPVGTVLTSTPTYTWTAVAGATSYGVLVVNTSNNKIAILEYYASSAVCSGSACAVTSGVSLAAGNYSWQARSGNAAGASPWSAKKNFSPSGPPAPTGTAPTGRFVDPTPTFSWTTSNSANAYNLLVLDENHVTKYVVTYGAADVCSGTSCTVTPVTVLPIGQYYWQVRGVNTVGGGAWSTEWGFYADGTPAPVAIAPTGTVLTTTPTYSWQPVAGATGYQLQALNPDGSQKFIDTSIPTSVCSGTTCSFTSGSTLVMGTYTWRVRGTHAGGGGAWCQPVWISVEGPPKPTGTAPTGRFVDPTPTFSWTTSNSANAYNLLVLDENHAMKYVVTYGAADVCSGASCTVTPDTVLPIGQYYWQVRGVNTVGGGVWSTEWGFFADGTAAPVALGPTGRVLTTTPTFSWQPTAGATDYQLEVLRSDGTRAFIELGIPTSVCAENTCSFTSSVGLVMDAYTWHVHGTHGGGGGAWCQPVWISVEGPPAPTGTAPTGRFVDPTPTFSWTTSNSANAYNLLVLDENRVMKYVVTYGAADVCSDVSCTVTPDTALPIGQYYWQVRGVNSVGGGVWSAEWGFYADGTAAPTTIAPSGTILQWLPTFSWAPTAGATGYQLEILNAYEVREFIYLGLPAQDICSSTVCSLTVWNSLHIGPYSWRVVGTHEGGRGAWSALRGFYVQGPYAPVQISPRGRVFTTTPSIKWWPAALANNYYIEVYAGGESPISTFWAHPSQACVAAAHCETSIPEPLAGGSYTWRILGRDEVGNGPYSGRMAFIVEGAPRPAPTSNPGPPTPLPTVELPVPYCPIWSGATQCGYQQYIYQSGQGADPLRLQSVLTPQAQATVALVQTTLAVGETTPAAELSVLSSPMTGIAPCGCPAPGAVATYQTADVTAVAGSDYVQTQGTLPLTRDGGSLPIAIPIINNCTEDAARSFQLTLAPGVNAIVPPEGSQATVTIADNDATTFGFTGESSSVAEAGTWLTSPPAILGTREDATCPSRSRSVTVEIVAESAATPDDFAVTSPLSLTEGVPEDVPVTIVDDTAMEGGETFSLGLPPAGSQILTSHRLTIEDDDSVSPPLALHRVAPCGLLNAESSVLTAGESRVIAVAGACGVSATARAVVLGVAASESLAAGTLEVKVPEAGAVQEPVLHFQAGENAATNGHFVLGPDGSLSVKNTSAATVRVVLDVVGYFE